MLEFSSLDRPIRRTKRNREERQQKQKTLDAGRKKERTRIMSSLSLKFSLVFFFLLSFFSSSTSSSANTPKLYSGYNSNANPSLQYEPRSGIITRAQNTFAFSRPKRLAFSRRSGHTFRSIGASLRQVSWRTCSALW